MKDGKYVVGGINDKVMSMLFVIFDNECMLCGF